VRSGLKWTRDTVLYRGSRSDWPLYHPTRAGHHCPQPWHATHLAIVLMKNVLLLNLDLWSWLFIRGKLQSLPMCISKVVSLKERVEINGWTDFIHCFTCRTNVSGSKNESSCQSIVDVKYVDMMPSVLWCCWLGGRKGIRPVKNWSDGLVEVHICIWPSRCHCHSLSLAPINPD